VRFEICPTPEFPVLGNVAALNSAMIRGMVTEPIMSIDFNDGR
jgi:hypothetical protein